MNDDKKLQPLSKIPGWLRKSLWEQGHARPWYSDRPHISFGDNWVYNGGGGAGIYAKCSVQWDEGTGILYVTTLTTDQPMAATIAFFSTADEVRREVARCMPADLDVGKLYWRINVEDTLL